MPKSKPWSEEEAAIAARMREGHSTYAEIAARLGRSSNSVEHALRSRNVKLPEVPKFDPRDVADPTDVEVLRLEREKLELQQRVKELNAKLTATHREQGLFQELAQVIRTTSVPLPPARQTKITPKKDATPCDLVLLLADEHADEVVNCQASWGLEEYNFNIFRVRLQRLFDLVVEYSTIHLPRHHFERLWIFKLGDSINGDVHGHGPRNHFANTLKAALAVGDVEAQFVSGLLPFFECGVHVVGVSGNHPRRSSAGKKDFDGPLDNFDYLVGTQMATRLAPAIDEGRASVTLPEAWSAFVRVRNGLWALNHGDDATSYTGLPWVGFDRRNNRVQTALQTLNERVNFFCYGHFHTPANFISGGAKSVHSGAWCAADTYALNRLAMAGEPQQDLMVIDDKPGTQGLILPIPIYVRDAQREQQYRAQEYDPALGRHLVLDTVRPKTSEGFQVVKVS